MGSFNGKLQDVPKGWTRYTHGSECIKYREFHTKAKFIAAVNSRDTELIFKACIKDGLKDLRDVCLSRLSKEEQKKFRLEAEDNRHPWRGWVHQVTKDELVKSLMEIRRCLISKTDVWKNNYIL